jgi:uncharacterized membrane protein YqaE (UPF0057 family)
MDTVEKDIQKGEYNLISRILYGGLCSGAIVIPSNFIKVILTLIFPPLGTLLEVIWDGLIDKFPYITWDALIKIFDPKNFNNIVYTFVLTSLFYVPGLVYALALLNRRGDIGYTIYDPNTGEVIATDKDGNPITKTSNTPTTTKPV